MRTPIPASTSPQGSPTRIYHSAKKANIKLQIFDPVTLFVSQQQADLTSLDAGGNPQRGLQLAQGIYDFLGFSGEMWVTCNQQISIEVAWWFL